jgi:hypothetical protein
MGIGISSACNTGPDNSSHFKPQSEETAGGNSRGASAATEHNGSVVSYYMFSQSGLANHFTIVETSRPAISSQQHHGSAQTVKRRTNIQTFLGRHPT